MFAKSGTIWIKFRRLVHNDMSTAVMWSKSKPDVKFQYGERLGEFNGMLSQSTMQGAATWRIHCHDSRATCHIAGCSHMAKSMWWSCHIAGCKIPSATLKIVFFAISFLSASLYFSKRGAYWDRLCRDIVGRWLSLACTVSSIAGTKMIPPPSKKAPRPHLAYHTLQQIFYKDF